MQKKMQETSARQEYEKAARVWEALVAQDLQNPQLHFNLAWAYLRVFSDAQALEHFERVIFLNPAAASQVRLIMDEVRNGTVERFPE